MALLAVVANHARTADALALRASLRSGGEVCLIDSGSPLSPEERAACDVSLPNVYYGGLLNAAHAALHARPQCEALLFWASDVFAHSPGALRARAAAVLSDPGIGLYAPAAPGGSAHPQMHPRAGGKLRRVTFADGFCFAVRRTVLDRLCPVDTSLNALGWGYDVALGYYARRAGLACVVDDSHCVQHPRERGYARSDARLQRAKWISRQARGLRWFSRLSGLAPLKTRAGMAALLALPW